MANTRKGVSRINNAVGRRDRMLCSKRSVKSNTPYKCGPNWSSLLVTDHTTLAAHGDGFFENATEGKIEENNSKKIDYSMPWSLTTD
jgi:hypothetical protein